MKKDSEGRPVLTPEFFTNVMRQYHCTWIIDGVEWGGPTAANCTPYIALDYLIGTSDPQYNEHILTRLRYMTQEDQKLLIEDMGRPSIARKILDKLGFVVDDFIKADDSQVAEIIAGSDNGLFGSIRTFNDIVERFSLLSGLHSGLMKHFFRPGTSSAAKKSHSAHIVVDNTKGTSGMSFQEVKRIREMRKSNLVLGKLRSASLMCLR